MEREDHEGLSEKLEREADHLEDKVKELGEDIAETRSDWEAKKKDPAVPGAQNDEAASAPPEADTAPGDQPGETAS
jgi:hypothetical protein